MKLMFLMGMILLLVGGCSVTIIHYGDRGEPYDHSYKGDWGDWEKDDNGNTATATPGGGTNGSDTATAKPNPELKKRLMEQLKTLQPILTKEYNNLLASKPDLTGTIVMRVTVSGDGKVKGLNVISNTTGDDRLVAALEHEIKSLNLGTGNTAPSDVVFDIPFKFANGIGEIGGIE